MMGMNKRLMIDMMELEERLGEAEDEGDEELCEILRAKIDALQNTIDEWNKKLRELKDGH
jgi:hypothetical protein